MWRLKKTSCNRPRNDNSPVSSPVCAAGDFHPGSENLLTIGMVNDMFVESRNDEYKGWRQVATQEDFDRF